MVTLPGDYSPLARATIATGLAGMPLNPLVVDKIAAVVVDQHLLLPDMFEITLLDDGSALGMAMITIGTPVTISGGAADSMTGEVLIEGEVTSIEGDYEGHVFHTIVRGYEKAHRLQRARRTRSFTNMSDGDIVQRVASEAQISTGTIEDPGVTHEYLAQINQTDWEFLKMRAFQIGYEIVVTGGELHFRPASGSSMGGGGGGLGGAAMAAAASAVGLGAAKLTFGKNMTVFKPRLSAANLTPEVEVRIWDPKRADVVVANTAVVSGTAKLDKDASDMAAAFDGPFAGLPFSPPSIPGLPSLGPAESNKAIISIDGAGAWGSSTDAAADALAAGLAEHVGSTYAEAEGTAYGNPGFKAGAEIEIDNVPDTFAGKWTITQARHTFDDSAGGYLTHFTVSGRNERSLLGLASVGRSQVVRPRIDGLVIGIVTNNNDPDSMGRVKLSFPWLSPSFESDWARVAQLGAGKKWGTCFVPEVGDEVLVGFEVGGRPYVLGGLFNGKSEHPMMGNAVKVQGPLAQVVKHGIVSRLGNQIVFEDDEPMPDSPPPSVTASSITISDKDGKVKVVLDKKSGEITILCDSTLPPAKINIEQKGTGGSISVTSDGDISIEAKAPGKLTLKGGLGVEITGGAPGGVKIDGKPTIALN